MSRAKRLSPARRHQVDQIRHVLGRSDANLHHLMVTLDAYEREASQATTATVRPERIHTLNLIHAELMRAVTRLGELNTGLQAQDDLRRALLAAAQGYTAWGYALGTKDLQEAALARGRVQRHFETAAVHGDRGTARLATGT